MVSLNYESKEYLIFQGHFGLSTVEELELAINNCKMLILSAQEHSERRRSLVNKLVQLRLQLSEAKVMFYLYLVLGILPVGIKK